MECASLIKTNFQTSKNKDMACNCGTKKTSSKATSGKIKMTTKASTSPKVFVKKPKKSI